MNLKKAFDKVITHSATQTASFFTGSGSKNISENNIDELLKDINGKDASTINLIRDIVSGKLKESKLTEDDWKRIEALFRVLCNCQRSVVMAFVNGKMSKFENIFNELKRKLEIHMIERKNRDDSIFKELRDIRKNAFGNNGVKK